MEKKLRCTVCTWRGSWLDALNAPRHAPTELPESDMRIQAAYEDRQSVSVRLGAEHAPSCPDCGHHTALVRQRSVRPAM